MTVTPPSEEPTAKPKPPVLATLQNTSNNRTLTENSESFEEKVQTPELSQKSALAKKSIYSTQPTPIYPSSIKEFHEVKVQASRIKQGQGN